MAIAAAGMPNPNEPRRLLLQLGLLGEREAQQARAQAMGMAFADLERIQISPEAAVLISNEKKKEWRALPLKRDRGTLWVAVEDPNSPGIQLIKEETGLKIVLVLCISSALDDALAKLG